MTQSVSTSYQQTVLIGKNMSYLFACSATEVSGLIVKPCIFVGQIKTVSPPPSLSLSPLNGTSLKKNLKFLKWTTKIDHQKFFFWEKMGVIL